MKIQIRVKESLIGYHKLSGVHRSRIKARSKRTETGIRTHDIESIIKDKGEYTTEYRLVKEPEGFIFREVLSDCGISGHHSTQRKAIYKALDFVNIYIDEDFEHKDMPDFAKYERYHSNREKGCKHKDKFINRWGNIECPDCQHL